MKRKIDNVDRALVKKYENLYMVNPALYGVEFANPYFTDSGEAGLNQIQGEAIPIIKRERRFQMKAIYADVLTLAFLAVTVSTIWTKLPWIPFFCLAVLFFIIGIKLHFDKSIENQLNMLNKAREDMLNLINPNRMYELLGEDILCLQVSENLIPVADPDDGSSLLAKTAELRHRLTDSLGYIIPNIRIQDSQKLDKNMYSILVRGKTVFTGRLSMDEISEQDVKKFIEELEETCIKYAPQIMEKADAIKLIEIVRSQDPTLANDLVPMFLSAVDLKIIFSTLISQRISIKDITYIFEILNNHARYTRDLNELIEIIKKELNFNLY